MSEIFPASNKQQPSLAMVMCVRDEEDYIGANLAYHHALGVSRAYIFADRCRDRTIEIAQTFPWARVRESDIDPSLDMVLHQRRCADEALRMARDEGVQWLMHIDADEFAFADNLPFGILGRAMPFLKRIKYMTALEKGDLLKVCRYAAGETEMILMRTWEAVPVLSDEIRSFWELPYFHKKSFSGKKVLDPVSNEIKELPWFGHARGKTIVRVGADVQTYNAHLWTRYQGKDEPKKIPIPTEYRGHHFHFLFTNPEEWQNKFRKHSDFPATWHSNEPVEFPKQSWKEASARMTQEEAQRYFNEWLAMRPDELRRQISEGNIIRETAVEDILKESKWAGLKNT